MGAGRIPALDNLKVALVAGVIVAHAAMTYGAAGSWIFEAKTYGDATLSSPMKTLLSVGIVLGVLFAMGLFLYVAGLFTPDAIRRYGPAEFSVRRLTRLGPPLAAYVFVVVPLLGVLINSTVGENNRGLLTDYWRQLRVLGAGPLWFVAILLAVSISFALSCRVIGLRPPRPAPLRTRYLVSPAVVIAAGSFLVRLAFPVDSSQILDAHVWLWPQCFALFALGILSAQHRWLQPVPDQLRRRCGRSALVAFLVVVLILSAAHVSSHTLNGGWHWPALLLDILEGIYAVGASIWVLGLVQRHFNRQGAFARRCSRAAYGAFVVQAPVLVGFALALHTLDAPADLKFALLAVGATIGSFAITDAAIEIIHRRTSRKHRRVNANEHELAPSTQTPMGRQSSATSPEAWATS